MPETRQIKNKYKIILTVFFIYAYQQALHLTPKNLTLLGHEIIKTFNAKQVYVKQVTLRQHNLLDAKEVDAK